VADADRDPSAPPPEPTRPERPSVPKLAALEPPPRDGLRIDDTGPRPSVRTCPACQATNAGDMSHCTSCGESLLPDPLVGKVVDDRYEVGRRLGAGAMGAVYEVRHLRLNKRFAMKVIHRELSQVPEFVARFEREALSTSRLQHPNCILVTDFGRAPSGELYLVMEFLEGSSLSQQLDKPLPVRTALEITRQVLLGVQHAHEAGVIHRDLKPDNVVRIEKSDGTSEIKVVDFGIAKIPLGSSDKEQPLTKAGVVFGTPQYMAPEQALGGEIGPPADLYAIGAMLWRMIVGRHVFEADGHMEVLSAKLAGPAPELDRVVPGVFSPALQALLCRCLERTPSTRIQTAKEMIEAIDQILREPGAGLAGATASGEGLGTRARRLVTVAGSTAVAGGRSLAGMVSGWYRCEGLGPGEPTWKLRARGLVSTSRGAGVLGLAVAALTLLLIVPLLLGGGDEGSARVRAGSGSAAQRPKTTQPPSKGGPRPGKSSGTGTGLSTGTGMGTAMGTGTGSAAPIPAGAGRAAFERGQAQLLRGSCVAGELEARAGLSQEPASPRGRLILGAALYCQGKHRDGLDAYGGAIAVEPSYKRHPRILEDVERSLRSDRTRKLAFDFMERTLGEAALPILLPIASGTNKLGQHYSLRHRAVDDVRRLGAASKVNWLSSYALDLKQLRDCRDRAAVVEQLGQLKDVRAIPVLRAALKERTGWFGRHLKNRCIKTELGRTLAALEKLPGAEAYR
jgi:eukaryotic-like serine/threonine-protein kinase